LTARFLRSFQVEATEPSLFQDDVSLDKLSGKYKRDPLNRIFVNRNLNMKYISHVGCNE
jgi:hypothetical protein